MLEFIFTSLNSIAFPTGDYTVSFRKRAFVSQSFLIEQRNILS